MQLDGHFKLSVIRETKIYHCKWYTKEYRFCGIKKYAKKSIKKAVKKAVKKGCKKKELKNHKKSTLKINKKKRRHKASSVLSIVLC